MENYIKISTILNMGSYVKTSTTIESIQTTWKYIFTTLNMENYVKISTTLIMENYVELYVNWTWKIISVKIFSRHLTWKFIYQKIFTIYHYVWTLWNIARPDSSTMISLVITTFSQGYASNLQDGIHLKRRKLILNQRAFNSTKCMNTTLKLTFSLKFTH